MITNTSKQINNTHFNTFHKQQKTKIETEIDSSNAAFSQSTQNKKQVFGPQISFDPESQIKINRVFK